LARFASQHVKVVIGGDGGDELFGGYDRYYGNLYAGYYAAIPKPVRKYMIGPVLERIPDGGWYKSKAHQAKWLHELSFLESGERYAKALGYFYFHGALKRQLYGPRFEALQESLRPEQWILELFARARVKSPLDRMLYTDSFSRLPDHPVMLSDRMTMASSLECRAPFMDHRLAEFVAKVPARFKVSGRKLRYLQRALAARYLPAEVLARPKQGFSSALPYMLKDEYALLFNAFLRDSALAADGFLRQDGVSRLLEEHLSGRRDHGNRLWLLCSSETWYRAHIKGVEPAELRDRVRAQTRGAAAA
jgi:asparagine synthase (glutamine-hydrolysing)